MTQEYEYREFEGHQFYWPLNDKGGWHGPTKDWQIHSESIKKYCHNYLTVLQAGGCCGLYPFLLSKMFATVYTFEPDEVNYSCLVKNCESAPNIIKSNEALGDVVKKVGIDNRSKHNIGTHKIIERKDINQTRIDDLCLNRLDLLMLDVEGYEKNALLGAKSTIKKFRPVIFAENGHNLKKFMMETFNYKFLATSAMDSVFGFAD